MTDSSRVGRVAAGRRGLLCLLIVLTGLCTPVVSATASAPSGGVRRPAGPTASAAGGNALVGRGMWIWVVSQSSGGSLTSIVGTSHTYGLNALMIKAGDGTAAWSQFSSPLVAALHARGLKVCAWQYVYGNQPIAEAEVGARSVHAGADCLLIDAESEYQGKYIQAQQYIRKLRQLIGSRYPVALAGFPYVDYHPGFPYSVFLGPGGAQYNVPQMYWPDIGTSVDEIYAHTFEFNTPYQRPIEPLGEVAGNPPPGQVLRFRQMSRSYGATGVSWWDWQASSTRDWRALDQPVGNLAGFQPTPAMPLLGPRGSGGIWAGDLVVWAQEHLVTAGEPLQIDGSFGAATQAAVEQFQAAKGLPVDGLIGLATWGALLRYPRANVTWSKRGGNTVATASRARLELPVPWSARLPARHYEIPHDLGAGAGPSQGRRF